MTAPTGTNTLVRFNEYTSYTFSEADFGFADSDADAMLGVYVSPTETKLMFDGAQLTSTMFISVGDLHKLSIAPRDWGGNLAFYFRVVDDSGEPDNTDQIANRIDFLIKDLEETFRGTKRAERIEGTGGRDIIDGRGGNDQLVGMGWKDTFIFSTGYGKDVIVDASFTSTRKYNVVDLSELDSVKSYRDLMYNHVKEHIKDIWIDGGDGDILVLKNTDIHDLDRNEFMF